MNMDQLILHNLKYRTGNPDISDKEYDKHYMELQQKHPDHVFFSEISDDMIGKPTVRHKDVMLSTAKAYNQQELTSWVKMIQRKASGIDLGGFSVTHKLDGMAAELYQGILSTNTDGISGVDITHIIDLGLVIPDVCLVNPTVAYVGEIVVDIDYFRKHLSKDFEHPRNFVVGAVKSPKKHQVTRDAFKAGAIGMVPFVMLEHTSMSIKDLLKWSDDLESSILDSAKYPVDGLVITVNNPHARKTLGETSHHPRWSIAKKLMTNVATSTILGHKWQVGRTGKVTPVVQIEPVKLSGSVIDSPTGHNLSRVLSWGMGVGAHITISRAGEVIPKIISVTAPVYDIEVPDTCPECDHSLVVEGPFLVCKNELCRGRQIAGLLHFFNIIGSVNGIGPIAAASLIDSGYIDIDHIYMLSVKKLVKAGISPGDASNIYDQLALSLKTPIKDYILLAAFGIHHLGRGDSKKILTTRYIQDICKITEDELGSIKGFGKISTPSICKDLHDMEDYIHRVIQLGWDIDHTMDMVITEGSLTGKRVVFTGKMPLSRGEMKDEAISKGILVGSSVSGNTDYLVTGGRVGASKLVKAKDKNVTIISVTEYFKLIRN